MLSLLFLFDFERLVLTFIDANVPESMLNFDLCWNLLPSHFFRSSNILMNLYSELK